MVDYIMKCVEVGIMPTNCYILRKQNSRDAVVIDPGADVTVIKDALFKMDAQCKLILLTHGHFDHILAVGDLRSGGKPVAIHRADAHSLTERDMFSPLVTFDPRPFGEAEIILDGDGFYSYCGFEFEVLYTPGHTKGSVCYIFGDKMFTGDTLFRGSVGTVDFGGDEKELRESLRKLRGIPREYALFPGHDASTTLTDEKESNPYMRELETL